MKDFWWRHWWDCVGYFDHLCLITFVPLSQALQGVPSHLQATAGERLLPCWGRRSHGPSEGGFVPFQRGEPSPADGETPPVGFVKLHQSIYDLYGTNTEEKSRLKHADLSIIKVILKLIIIPFCLCFNLVVGYGKWLMLQQYIIGMIY